jgi:hypothetical protein
LALYRNRNLPTDSAGDPESLNKKLNPIERGERRQRRSDELRISHMADLQLSYGEDLLTGSGPSSTDIEHTRLGKLRNMPDFSFG